MKRYITVDGGTSNTRINLVEDKKITATVKLSRGARAGIDDRQGLTVALRDTISEILKEHSLTEKDIIRILASGMITSEFGLYELPHLSAPAGIRELHESTKEVAFPEISSIPFVFIRGVKVDSDSLSDFDMMRGEETELMGLFAQGYASRDKEQLFVLPGSHSKLIRTDNSGRITSFSTMLSGEMILSLSQNTILKDAVDLSVSEYDEEMLSYGYRFAKEEGLNKTLFKVRILKNRFKRTPQEICSFFIGAALADEIDSIISSGVDGIAIGGKSQIKTATAILLRSISSLKVTEISDEAVDLSTALGAISVYESC